jgi:nucleoside-diphosphate-sugar epimerase
MPSTKVLIIGAGQVGAFTAAELLARGADVALADLRPPPSSALAHLPAVAALPVNPVDICDPFGLARLLRRVSPDVIVHTAAVLPGVDAYTTYRVNVQGVANVIEAARMQGVDRVVYTSSSVCYYAAFGRPDAHGATITEDAPVAFIPGFFYGNSKIAADILARDMATEGAPQVAVCRLGHVWGPWGHALGAPIGMLLKQLVDAALGGKPLTIENPFLAWRGGEGFAYVRNVADVLASAALAPTLHHVVYNCFDPRLATLDDFLQAICRRLPTAKLGEIARTESGYAGMPVPPPSAFDVSRARNDLGYQGRFDVQQGIDEYVTWAEAVARPIG